MAVDRPGRRDARIGAVRVAEPVGVARRERLSRPEVALHEAVVRPRVVIGADDDDVGQIGGGGGGGEEQGEGTDHGGDGDNQALACRIRIAASGDADALFAGVRGICCAHPGRTPLFVHVLLPEQEVVIRVKGLSVAPAPEMAAEIEALLGSGTMLVEYAGRA